MRHSSLRGGSADADMVMSSAARLSRIPAGLVVLFGGGKTVRLSKEVGQGLQAAVQFVRGEGHVICRRLGVQLQLFVQRLDEWMQSKREVAKTRSAQWRPKVG